MKKDINSNEENNNPKYIPEQTSNNIDQNIVNDKINEKETTMSSIKNMFNLNKENNNFRNKVHYNNSFYKKRSENTNQEEEIHNNYNSLIPRTFSNNQINKEQHFSKNNFPSKANVCKGNPKINNNFIFPNSSPIFQYYASNQTDNFLNTGQAQELGSPLDNTNSLGYLGGRDSPHSTGFNFSPSQIFNKNGNINSGSVKMKSETNIGFGIPFSIDSENDEDKMKNLDFKPYDDLYTIKFDDENYDINFAEDKNIIVNKINEQKNKKNQNYNVNNNINNNINNNSNVNNENNKNNNINNNINNDTCIEIENNIKKQEKEINNTKNISNLPIKMAMEKLRKKKIQESDELVNEKPNNDLQNNTIGNNNKENKEINIDSQKDSNHQKLILTKLEDGKSIDLNQKISTDFKSKFGDNVDKIDNENSCENNNIKNEGINMKTIEKKEENIDFNIRNNTNEIGIKNNNKNNKKIIDNNQNIEKKDENNNNNYINYNANQFENKNQINNTQNQKLINNIDFYNKSGMTPAPICNKNNNGINDNNIFFNNNLYNNTLFNNNYNFNYLNNNFNNYFLNGNNFNYNNNNNAFNPNYNNSNNFLQQNYYMINNSNNPKFYNPQSMNTMMNQPLNNNINNYFKNQIPQQLNQNNFNNNINNTTPNYNQFLQSSGNINIQNNYFMYNNQENLKNNQNSNEQNDNNNQNTIQNNINDNKQKKENTNEKPKKKKKKKAKRLDSSSYVNKPLSYIAENFYTMAKDQGASRYLQQLLDSNPKEVTDFLFVPLCKTALKLVNDPFGNYLIQKIMTYFNQDQLLNFLTIISPSFYEISCNPHGTRVLQKMIGYLSSPIVKNYFFELVKPIVTPLLKDLNGTYIVQKFATQNINDLGLKINAIIIENASELCTHRHGCCVIQKYLETKDKTMIPELIDKLIKDCLLLIIDQFGNYVIQTILLMGDKKYGNILAENISSNIVFYAKHKYSSNVVEKCFDYCDGIYLKNLIGNVQKKENLIKLILDEHGNYVVQKVLSLSSAKKQKNMLSIIKSVFDKLKTLPHGDKVINRIVNTYPIINNC